MMSPLLGLTARTVNDDVPRKFIIVEKENLPVKKDTEVLVLSKDSGKQFSSISGKTGTNNLHSEKNLILMPVWM